jgi:predicted signal transduction protein with EAL and GGDEF domain
VLAAIGKTLATCTHGAETVARIGGDEFAILLPPSKTGWIDPVHSAMRYYDQVCNLSEVGGQEVQLSCSIGIARFPEQGDTVAALIHSSDQAMYAAKRQGGGVQLCSDRPLEAARPATGRLDAALAQVHTPITLEFQPWIDVATGRDAGVEVLARWTDQDRSLSAEEFLPEAERAGLISGIGQLVIRKACQQWSALREAGIEAGSLAVNVSATELLEDSFVPMLIEELAATQLEPYRLRIEVRGATLSLPAAAKALSQLRQAGCRIVLDRFGEDGTDLAILSRIPLDGIKLHRPMMRRMADDGPEGSAGRLLAATLGAAAGLGIPAVVAGVESEEDARLLAFIGCRYQQGYWYSPGLSADQLVERLRRTAPRPDEVQPAGDSA